MAREAPGHDNVKQTMVAATGREPRLVFRTLRSSSRVLRNAVVEEVLAIASRPGRSTFEGIRPRVAGAQGHKAMEMETWTPVSPLRAWCAA